MTNSLDADVIIVGGGIAGLTCANTLRAAGLTAIVMEKSHRLGGRIWTSESGKVERGARVLHAWPHHPLAKFPSLHTLRTIAVNYEKTAVFAGDGIVLSTSELDELNELSLEFAGALDELSEESGNTASVLELANMVLNEADDLTPTEQQAIQWVLACRELETSLALDRVSYAGLASPQLHVEEECNHALHDDPSGDTADEPGNGTDVIVAGGLGQAVSLLAEDLVVHLNAPVRRVDWGTDGASVQLDGAARFYARHIVIAVPISALRAGDIRFAPPLPSPIQAAIEGLDCGAEVRISLDFDQPYWPKSPHFFGIFSESNETCPQLINHWPTEGIARITAVLAGRLALQLCQESDDVLQEHALKAVHRVIESPLPPPLRTTITRWVDGYDGVGNSAVLVGQDAQVREPLLANQPGLSFAGEATSVAHPGTIEGAAESGVRAAQAIISTLQP